MQHREIGRLPGLLDGALFVRDLGLKYFALGGCEIELHRGHNFARALADAHVAQSIFAGITPITEQRTIGGIGWRAGEVFKLGFQFDFAYALDEIFEGFASRALRDILRRKTRDDFRNSLRRNRDNRQTVRAAVVGPLAAENHLEVRHRVPCNLAADAVETEIGDVMLSATIEAAADFDMQILDGFVKLDAFLIEPLAQFGG